MIALHKLNNEVGSELFAVVRMEDVWVTNIRKQNIELMRHIICSRWGNRSKPNKTGEVVLVCDNPFHLYTIMVLLGVIQHVNKVHLESITELF